MGRNKTKKSSGQVRYVSPFGSPAYMSPAQAQALLIEDTRIWEERKAIERETGSSMFTAAQREVGPPRIVKI